MNKPTKDAILKRLLGPADREVLCDECFEKLDVYVDLELNGAPADELVPGMRAHLEGCPACQEEYASLRELVETDEPHK
jgi:anti-sigma factor RsiW